MLLILAMLSTQFSMMVASLAKHENGIFKATWYWRLQTTLSVDAPFSKL
jgi:hypothetical protein